MGRISCFSRSMWVRCKLGLRIREVQRLLGVNARELFVARQRLAALQQAGGALAGDEELSEEEELVVSEEEV